MRVAFWGPLPPEEGGAAEQAALLLPELARRLEVVAIVRDELVGRTLAPPRVEVVAASRYGPYGVDLDVYHLGNEPRQHAEVHRRARERPGVALLHEPSLAGLYAAVAGPRGRALLEEEAWRESGGVPSEAPGPTLEGGRAGCHGVAPLPWCSPRVAAASLCAVVDSAFAAGELVRRAPGSVVEVVRRAAWAGPAPGGAGEARAVVVPGPAVGRLVLLAHGSPSGLVAGAAVVLAAAAARDGGEVTVVAPPGALAGPAAVAACHAAGLGAVRAVEMPASMAAIAQVVAGAALAVLLEGCNHGGTSPLVAACLASGVPVVVADHPQYRELTAPAVSRVAVDEEAAMVDLADLLAGADGAWRAGARRAAAALGRAHAPAEVAGRMAEVLAGFADGEVHRRRVARRSPEAGWPPGVNAIASFEATTGLAEAARRYASALVAAGVRVAIEDYDYRWAPRVAHRFDEALRALPRGRPYDVELCSLNVNELHILPERYLRPPHTRRHVIGSWFWELPDLPRSLHEQVARVDEVWAPSPFVAEAFAPHTRGPVEVVPCVVEPARDERLGRPDFGLSPSRRCYFFQFDCNSTLARKNPFGVIDAFARAFPRSRRGDVQLVMKTLNLHRHPEAAMALRARMAEVDGLIVDADLTVEAMGSLTAACDVFVSLHRAEGFGLGLAEAMYFGKPVVGTAYSGNLAFMSVTNSCLVGYRMRPVTIGELRFNPGSEVVYEPGQRWAEPDLDDAVDWLRFCHDEPAAADRLGRAGAATIRDRCSRAAVGGRMRELLEERRAG